MNNLKMLDIIREDLRLVEEEIIRICRTHETLLAEATHSLIFSGGKRLRPALVLLCSNFGRPDKAKVISAAAAIELIHAATLVHDDIIDESVTRRGAETVQHRWGKDNAVFTGDFLFTKAFSVLSQILPAEALKMTADVIVKICEGEVNQYQNRYNDSSSLKHYLSRVKKKTALLFALSCEIGALLSSNQATVIRLLKSYGMNLGVAFQITDDVMDIVSSEQEMGKPPGSDILEGVYTLPILFALKNSPESDRLKNILSQGNIGKAEINEAILIIKCSGAIEYSFETANRYLNKVGVIINRLPDNQSIGCFKEIAAFIGKRRF